MYWKWFLTHRDLESIEASHSRVDAYRTVSFTLEVSGLAQLGEVIWAIRGESQVTIPRSEWEDLVLRPLGYSVPPSWSELLPNVERLGHPAWTDAVGRLEAARRLLRAGQARDALDAALDAFESVVTSPYLPESWLPVVSELPQQKQAGFTAMLGGICDYLNKVGHHRDRADRNAQGHLQEMPVDQWEAEHVLGAAQLLLGMVLRYQAPPPE